MITVVNNLNDLPNSCLLAVGKFESLHLGHQALLKNLEIVAKKEDLPIAIMSFDPHPYIALSDTNYKPMFMLDEWIHLYNYQLGLLEMFLLQQKFDVEFATLSPEIFCEKLFQKAKIIAVGENFRFGHKREGTVKLLCELATHYNCKVIVTNNLHFSAIENNLEIISTSHIRKLLIAGQMQEAKQLLGFPFFALGTIIKGKQIGRTIGFPTANIYPCEKKFLPQDGVYSTNITIYKETEKPISYLGITNIGTRPTVCESKVRSVETHILEFKQGQAIYQNELYGQIAKVEFIRFIRPERRFESLIELKEQITKDIQTVKKCGCVYENWSE